MEILSCFAPSAQHFTPPVTSCHVLTPCALKHISHLPSFPSCPTCTPITNINPFSLFFPFPLLSDRCEKPRRWAAEKKGEQPYFWSLISRLDRKKQNKTLIQMNPKNEGSVEHSTFSTDDGLRKEHSPRHPPHRIHLLVLNCFILFFFSCC